MGEIDDYNPVLGRMHSDSWLVEVDLAKAIIGCSWMPDWYIDLEKNSRCMWIARKR